MFSNCWMHWKGDLFLPFKMLETLSKSAYKHRRYLLLNYNPTTLPKHSTVKCDKVWQTKWKTSNFVKSHRRASFDLNTKLGKMIEQARAIIASLIYRILSVEFSGYRAIEKFEENAPCTHRPVSNKNLAIANRSRVSCINLIIIPWPWNLV